MKRPTPKAHEWVSNAILTGVSDLIGEKFPATSRRVGPGPVARSEVVVRGPVEGECGRIRQRCAEIIAVIGKAVDEKFYGFHWLLPDEESTTTTLAFLRLEGPIGGMTAMIGPATRSVLAVLKAAGWQLYG